MARGNVQITWYGWRRTVLVDVGPMLTMVAVSAFLAIITGIRGWWLGAIVLGWPALVLVATLLNYAGRPRLGRRPDGDGPDAGRAVRGTSPTPPRSGTAVLDMPRTTDEH